MSIFDKFKKKPVEEATQTDTVAEQPAVVNAIGKEQVAEATKVLQEYKTGKKSLEERVIANDKWYMLRNWDNIEHGDKQAKPTSAWLFNSIANKHADAMDNFPAPNVLPREQGDEPESKRLSSIIPVVLEQCEFEKAYSEMWFDKLKSGTGIYSVTWDSTKLNGLGDISIKSVDILKLFWEPGVTDIQASKNLFHVELMDNDLLNQIYPQTVGMLGAKGFEVGEYAHDDTINTSNKSCVIDWYYKKNVGGKTVLHYCKYVNDIVLYATENETQPITNEEGAIIGPALAEAGLYDHGLYPFVFDVLYAVKGTPAGIGFIDIGKSAQEYIDRINQAILENAVVNTTPRYFIRGDGTVNEEEFADATKTFIHVEGSNLGDDSIRPVAFNTLNSYVLEVSKQKIEELKETTGNRDVSTGGTTSGATAASAIAAMQEAGSKLSRDNNKASYRAYRKVILLVIELIRQFYTTPRSFRIMGERGMMEYISYTNDKIAPQNNSIEFGIDMGATTPLFDIEITAEKASPYSRMAHNELIIQLFNMGVFNPQMSDQSTALLEALDFDGKDKLLQTVSKYGGMFQQMMQLAQMVDSMRPPQKNQPSVTRSLAAQYGMPMPTNTEAPDLDGAAEESPITKKARERTAEATSPV